MDRKKGNPLCYSVLCIPRYRHAYLRVSTSCHPMYLGRFQGPSLSSLSRLFHRASWPLHRVDGTVVDANHSNTP